MGEIINITDLINTLNAVDNYKDEDLIQFLNSIQGYKDLLLSKRDKMDKLKRSFNVMEGIKHIFLNVNLFLPVESLSDSEKKKREILEALRKCTDQFCGLMVLDMSEDELKEKSRLYEEEIVRLVKEYEDLVKEIAHNEVLSEFKGESK